MTRLRPGMRSETAEAVNQVSTTFRGAPLAPLLIACGRPNHERSSPPLLTVLLLLTGEHQEEGDGASNEGTWRPLRVGFLRGLFLAPCENGATLK